jgi:hypothetical protein
MGNRYFWAALLATTIAAATIACSSRNYDDGVGFKDGFASGYARECGGTGAESGARPRWRNARYTRGYADGLEAGVRACSEERREVVRLARE